jgi:hypothetical protein
VRGAGSLYADTVLTIPQLSPAGAAQLAADAEYFANVMSALAVAPPVELVTVQLFAAVPADSFGGLASGAAAGGSADVKVSVRTPADLRVLWGSRSICHAVLLGSHSLFQAVKVSVRPAAAVGVMSKVRVRPRNECVICLLLAADKSTHMPASESACVFAAAAATAAAASAAAAAAAAAVGTQVLRTIASMRGIEWSVPAATEAAAAPPSSS